MVAASSTFRIVYRSQPVGKSGYVLGSLASHTTLDGRRARGIHIASSSSHLTATARKHFISSPPVIVARLEVEGARVIGPAQTK